LEAYAIGYLCPAQSCQGDLVAPQTGLNCRESASDERRSLSSDYVSLFLTTTEGLALAKALMRIKQPAVRRNIVRLVEEIAGED